MRLGSGRLSPDRAKPTSSECAISSSRLKSHLKAKPLPGGAEKTSALICFSIAVYAQGLSARCSTGGAFTVAE
jgi:hypothetical protein